MRIALATALLLLCACSRSRASAGSTEEVPGAEDADHASDAHAEPPDAGAARNALPEEEPPAMFVEARRTRLAKLEDEPGLARNADTIRAHFGGALPASMELQAVPLASGRQALLLSALADDPRPIELVIDASGAALLTKERPLAGITPPARPYALAPRPDGGLALFVYDEPTKLVAVRMSAADGAPYAELMLFELQRCDAISAAWWPRHGWLVVTSFPAGMRAQLLREEGTSAWDSRGIAVGEPWRAAAPATILIEPRTSSWTLVQNATRSGRDHVVALRYDLDGNRVGKTADLGASGHVESTLDRVGASLVRPGVARVDVAGKQVELTIDAVR